jgi:NAD(P)-dependent dehydrogenase (short-subunit alcohol dehydrogenase family)
MPEKVAVLTGASSGFGLLTSVELAKGGFRVIASMRDPGKRERLAQAAAAAQVSDRIDVRALDVTQVDAIPEFVDSVIRDYGRIDVLVNNAGFAVGGFAEDIRLEELRLQFETNFFGAVAMTKAVLPVMRQQRSGHIIQVSSISGLQGAISVSSYSASKHALEGWSESLRLEVNSLGIKVVLVEPGAFDTGVWTSGAVMGQEAKKKTSPQLSAQPAHARGDRDNSESRSNCRRAHHRCHCPESKPEAALPDRPRRKNAAGDEAHPTLEVVRKNNRELPEAGSIVERDRTQGDLPRVPQCPLW